VSDYSRSLVVIYAREVTQLNSISHLKVANTRKEGQCELMYIPDS